MEEKNVKLSDAELNKILEDMKKIDEKPQTSKKRLTKEERKAKTFYPKELTETIRFLPVKNPAVFYETAYFHVVDLMTAKGKFANGGTIYCPAHNNKPKQKLDKDGNPIMGADGKPLLVPDRCPLCEKAKSILAKQDSTVKFKKRTDLTPEGQKIYDKNIEILKNASKWEAKEFYIVKVIDRGAQKDGVKIWRFKKNFKKDGVLDKLKVYLSRFLATKRVNFSDPQDGFDIDIVLLEKPNPLKKGSTYKEVSSFEAKNNSPLHQDEAIVRQWLNDKISWRDLFPPQEAPNMTSFEYLEMVANGSNPYWDDTNSSNKHWVFPGRPDLEEKANTRNQNLDADAEETTTFTYASDVDDEPSVTINNITESKVGTFKDDSVEMGKTIKTEVKTTTTIEVDDETDNDGEELGDNIDIADNDQSSDSDEQHEEWDDLPF